MNPTTKQIYSMNQAANRKKIVEPTPSFQDTFTCMIGEDTCPIKKQLSDQKIELQTKDLQIHDQQSIIEDLKQKFDDALESEPGGAKKLAQVVKEVKESVVVAGRDKTIREKDVEIDALTNEIAELKKEIERLNAEREQYMTTGYEADIKLGDRYREYQTLMKKHDHLVTKTAKLEAQDKSLAIAIQEKIEYDKELSDKINGMVDVANLLSKRIAKLKAQSDSLQKVKPEKVDTGKPGIFKRMFGGRQ